MKINILSLLLLTFLLLFFVACEEEVIIDDDLLQPSLVVNSFITPDSLIKVKLFESIPINSAFTKKKVSNGTVILYEDGQQKEELKLTYQLIENIGWEFYKIDQFDTIYSFVTEQTRAKLGKTYKLEITSPGFEKVTCETTIPNPVEIVSIDTSTTIKHDRDYTELIFNFKLRFKEPANEKNYYRLIIKSIEGHQFWHQLNGDTTYYVSVYKGNTSSYFNSTDPVLTFESENANSFIFGSPWNEYGIFSDEMINGKEYELSFSRSTGITDTEKNLAYDPEVGEFYNYIIDLQSIPYETYLFLKSIDGQDFNDDMPFSEPVPIFSTIENGLGIFGSYSSSTIGVMFGTYPMEGITYY